MHTATEAHETVGQAINYTLRQPLGVVGCISPWNLPLYLFSWKIAPALAAGCTVVAKPSEITPMTAYLLSKLCIEAGLPAGVLNIVHGLGTKAGSAIVAKQRGESDFLYRRHENRRMDCQKPRRCSKNYRSNSAAKTRTSFSPIAITKKCSRPLFARHFRIRDKSVCAVHEFLSKTALRKFQHRFCRASVKLKNRRSARS